VSQLPLPLRLHDYAVFETFHPAGNEEPLQYLAEQVTAPASPGCYLWGPPASGKSHLLQALCERAGDQSVYLPLTEVRDLGTGLVAGLADRRYVCVDDVQAVVGRPDWELALFELWNAVADAAGVLVVAADRPPRELGVELADLASRLSRLTVFRCNELPEPERAAALRLRALHRGLELPDDTGAYLLSRSRRDMRSLYRLLDRLDEESLAAQRRLTIPFVREVLARDSQD